MPFHKRVVQPQKIYQSETLSIKEGNRDTIDGEVRSGNLIFINGLLNQLCSLAKHADDLFADLETECKAVVDHTNSVRRKCALLEEKCLKLNHKTVKIPEGNLTEFSKQSNHFTTGIVIEQQHFCDGSRPRCVDSRYNDATADDKEKLQRVRLVYRKENKLSLLKSEPKIPNLELETRKPSLFTRYIEEKDSPWQRTRSADFDEFFANYCGDEIPLPTPDEQLQRNSKSQPSVLVPVDTSGQSFERMCRHRRSLQEIALRKKKRRVTVTGVPSDIVDRIGLPSTSSDHRSKITDLETPDIDDDNDSVFEYRIAKQRDRNHSELTTSNSSKLDNGYGTLERSRDDHKTIETRKEEKSKRWSWRGSFRDLTTRASRKDKSKTNCCSKPETVQRSSSMPPNKHVEDASRIFDEPLSARTSSQDTIQSLHSAKNGCLGFSRRSRSTMSKRKDKKDDNLVEDPPDGDIENENDDGKKEKKLTRSQSLTRRLSRVFSVRLRSPSKKSNKDERHSSGNWTGSTDSIKRCSDSSAGSADKGSNSIYDSAVEIHIPPPPKKFLVLPDSRSRSGSLGEDSVHSSNSSQRSQRSISLCDFRENFTQLDTNTWLESLEKDLNNLRGENRPELTTKHLEEHNAKLLSKSCNNVLLDEEQCSQFSVDQDGFYTSMHIDSGLKSMALAAKSLDTLSVSTTTSTLKCEPYSLSQSIDSVIYQQPSQQQQQQQPASTNNKNINVAKTSDAGVGKIVTKPKVKPAPPKRTTPLLKSKSSVSLNSQLATVLENPNEGNIPVQRKRYSTGSDSFSSSKLTIFTGSNSSMNSSYVTQSDQEPIYSRVKRKTVIDTTGYPSLCEVTPAPSDDDDRSYRDTASRNSMINTSGTLLLSSVPSVWSEFKSPYSTINQHLNTNKRYSYTETNNNNNTMETESGAADYSTLPTRLSAKKPMRRSISEQPTKQPVKTPESNETGNDMDYYNSWPRSPKHNNNNNNNDNHVTNKKVAPPPPPPPRQSSQLSVHDSSSMNSVNETLSLCTECRSRRSSGGSSQTLTGSQVSLTSTTNSTRSSGSSSRVPEKYQQHITVRPKSKGADGAIHTSQEHIYARVIVDTDTSNTAVNSSGMVSYTATPVIETPAHIYKNIRPPVYVNLEKPRPPTPERTYRSSGVYNLKIVDDHKNKPLPPTPLDYTANSVDFSASNVQCNAMTSTPMNQGNQLEEASPVLYASTNIVSQSDGPSHYSVSSDSLGETIAIPKSSSSIPSKAPMRSFSAKKSEAHSSVFVRNDEAKIYNVHEDNTSCIYSQPSTSPIKPFVGVLPRPYRAPQPVTTNRTSLSSKFASIRSGNRRYSVENEGATKTSPQDPSVLVAQARRNSLPNAKVYNVPYRDSSRQQTYSSLRRPTTLNVKSSKTAAPYSYSSLPRSASRQQTAAPEQSPELHNVNDSPAENITEPITCTSKTVNNDDADNDRVMTSLSVKLRHPSDGSYGNQMRRISAMERRLESRKSVNRDSVSEIDETQVMNILDSIRNTIKSIATKEADDNDSAIGSPENSSMLESNTNTL